MNFADKYLLQNNKEYWKFGYQGGSKYNFWREVLNVKKLFLREIFSILFSLMLSNLKCNIWAGVENKEFTTFLVPTWYESPGWKEVPQKLCENKQLWVSSQNYLEKHGSLHKIFCNYVDLDKKKINNDF